MKDETRIVSGGRHPEQHFGAVNPPVFHASTIISESMAAFEYKSEHRTERGLVVYGRFGTPTTFALEEAMAELEGAYASIAAASGKSAINCALLAFLAHGDHVLFSDSVYFPTREFGDTILARMGIEATYFDPLAGREIEDLMRPNTRVVFFESPGSLTFEVVDVPALVEVAHRHGAVVIMDNTWATPYFFKPLAFGVDVSVQAATKYIVGHSDAMLGVISTSEAFWRPVQTAVRGLGVVPGADEAYLGLRGLRTLAVRLDRHHANGLRIAQWLAARREVHRVLYPALPDDPGYDLWKRDFSGAAGLMGVVLAEPVPKSAVAAMIDGYAYFGIGASWGGYESLVMPAYPERFRSATEWAPPGPCLRIHVGIEDPEDLIVDLDAGFARLVAHRQAAE